MKSAVAELQRKRGETTTVSVQRSKILINNEEKDLKINKKETLKIENKKKETNTLSLTLLQCISCKSPYLVAYFSRATLSFSL